MGHESRHAWSLSRRNGRGLSPGEWNQYFTAEFGDGAPLWLSEAAAFYSELAYWLDRGIKTSDAIALRAEHFPPTG